MRTAMAGFLACALVLAGCGGETKEAADAIGNLKSIAESAGDMEKTTNKLDERRKARRASGDTVAMAPEKLLTFLPASIDGYLTQEPETKTMEIPGMSYTQVTRTYTGADNGSVSVTLMDLNSAEAMYATQTMLFTLKMRTENKDRVEGTFQTNNELINGHESWEKNTGDVTVTYGVGGRFWLQIKANNQRGTDWVKGIANRMDLNKLAQM